MRLEIGPGFSPRITGEDVIYIDRKALPYPNAIKMDLQELPLPFEDDYFDEIHAYQVLEHVPSLAPLLDELHRVIKPDGTLMLTVPHRNYESRHGPYPDHVHQFSEKTFRILEVDCCTKQWKVISIHVSRKWDYASSFITKPGRILRYVWLRRLFWRAVRFWSLGQKWNIFVELRPRK